MPLRGGAGVSVGPTGASPITGSFGRFLLAVAVVFGPLMVLSDFAPKFALLWAVAAGLYFFAKWGLGPLTGK